MKLTTTLFLLCCSFFLTAQKDYATASPQTYIYEITAAEAGNFYLRPTHKFRPNPSHFHTLRDSMTRFAANKFTENGHYIFVRVEKEEVLFELKSFASITARIFNDKRGFSIQVFDNEGVSVSGAEVYLEGKRVPFDSNTKTYLLEKQKTGGFLKITAQGETIFYSVRKDNQKWTLKRRWRRFASSPIGRFMTKPYRVVRGFVKYIHRSITHRKFQKIYWRKFIPFQRRFAQMKRNRKTMKGYMVLNKPKYQPGDTVKVKGYLTNYKGKPLRKSQILSLKDHRGYRSSNKQYFKEKIESNGNGNFVYEFVLGDSLKIDKSYTLAFSDDMNVRFTLEDYQLDEVEWSFSSDKKEYEATDFVVFNAEGKDANKNTIPDGKMNLILRVNRVTETFDSLILIPDTLWTYDTFLKPRGETKIIIPDSIFPAAKMQMTAHAKFQNANGETELRTQNFTISKEKKYFKDKFAGNSLSIAYVENGKVEKTSGTLIVYSKEGKIMSEEIVSFPLQKELTPTAYRYEVKAENKVKSIYVNQLKDNISVVAEMTKDSILVHFTNPHGTQINYLIQTSKKIIEKGETSAENFVFSHKNINPEKKYFITYHYIWAGTVQTRTTDVRGYKKLLKFAVEQDEKVLPGASNLVKIKVTDAKGKAAANVNLTAAAVNAQFKKDLAYQEPDISYRIAKEPENFGNFRKSAMKDRSGRTKINENWYETFGLDSLFFYRQRFSDTAKKVHYDSVYQDTTAKSLAQFTPHLLKNGISVPVYLIYCNRDLVYYYGTNDNAPFAFVGESGYNQITLRTREAEYTIDSVFLKKGWKAEVFIDIANSEKELDNQNIRMRSLSKKLTYQEKSLLNKSIFQIQNNNSSSPIYLWQNERTVHVLNKDKRLVYYQVGPFKNNESLHFFQENNAYYSFKYEPDFRYSINDRREKLYHSPLYGQSSKVELPQLTQTHLPGQVVHTRADIFTKAKQTQRISFSAPNFKDKRDGRINIKLRVPKDTSLYFCILENKADSIQHALYSGTRTISDLTPGEYRMRYYTSNGFFTQKDLTVKAHTTTWLHWENHVFIRDKYDLVKNMKGFNKATEAVRITPAAFSMYEQKKTGIIGRVTNAGSGEALPNVTIEVYLLGTLAQKTITDLNGKYQISLPEGSYQLHLKSLEDGEINQFPIFVNDSTLTVVDWIYNKNIDKTLYTKGGFTLETVTVISYKIPLIEMDNTTQGGTLTGEDISNLPKKNVGALMGKVAGISIVANKESVLIRGSRSDGTIYYIDGARVSGRIEGNRSVKKPATSGNYEIFGKVTDAETGEPILFGVVSVYRNGTIVTGEQTDFDGNYRIDHLPYGVYDVEFSYVGYASSRYTNVTVGAELNAAISAGVNLEVVVVRGYSVPVTERSLNFNLTLDKEEPLTGTQLRTQFKDYAYWQPNLITDKNGEAYYTAHYPDNITSWKTYVLGMDRKKRGGIQTGRVKSFKPLMAQLATPRFLIAGDKTEIIGKSVNLTRDSFAIQTQFLSDGKVIKSQQNRIADAVIEAAEITAPTADSLMLTYKLNTATYGDGEQREIPIFPAGIEETIGDFYLLKGDTSLTLDFNPAYGEVNIYAENDALEVLLKDLKYLRNYRYGCNEQTASKLTALLLEKQIATQLNRPFVYEEEVKKCLAILTKNQNEDGTWGWWSGNATNSWMTTYILKALAHAEKSGYKTTCLERGLRWMRSEVHRLEGRQLLNCLDLFSQVGLNMDYEKELSRLDTIRVPIYEHLTEVKIRQAQGLEYTLDSLQKYQQETIFGGIYWGKNRYHWYNNDLQLTRLAYEIYAKENKVEKQDRILQFFMEKRGQHHGRRFGRNTFEIAQIVSLILPKVLGENGRVGEANTLQIDDLSMRKFPFQTKMNSDNSLTINKSGGGTVFFTAYQQKFNPAPEAKADLFEIKSEIRQEAKVVQSLTQGEKVRLQVTLEVKKAADYIMVEIPIPAGCSYGNKTQNRYGSVEVHREYFKEKTSIFCRSLAEGTYTFEVNLEPRFSGDYTLNPATAEQMYFPVFYGRNKMKKVSVK